METVLNIQEAAYTMADVPEHERYRRIRSELDRCRVDGREQPAAGIEGYLGVDRGPVGLASDLFVPAIYGWRSSPTQSSSTSSAAGLSRWAGLDDRPGSQGRKPHPDTCLHARSMTRGEEIVMESRRATADDLGQVLGALTRPGTPEAAALRRLAEAIQAFTDSLQTDATPIQVRVHVFCDPRPRTGRAALDVTCQADHGSAPSRRLEPSARHPG